MRLAICNETFSDRSVQEGFRLAAEIGFTGIEIAPFTLSEELSANAELSDVRSLSTQARDLTKQAAMDAGLEIVGLHWLLAKTKGLYLTSPDVAVSKNTASYLVALAELCYDLGGKILVLGSPQQRNLLAGVSHEQAEEYAANVLSDAIRYFEDHGLTIALEPLGPTEGDFMNSAASAVRLIERVGSASCRLHLDVKAMTSEDQPIPEVIRTNAQYLHHFHANDPNLLGPGMGDIEFAPIIKALRDVQYDGWISVEVFKYEPSREEIARKSFHNLQAAMSWEESRPSRA